MKPRVAIPLLAGLLAVVAGGGFVFAADPSRLEALESAWRSGILTKEEYEAKKRALLANAPKPPAAKAVAAPAGKQAYQRMRVARVLDPEGWGEPVEVFRFLIPSDWKTEGGVRWVANAGCPSNIIQLRFRATAPDGITGIEFLPSYTWAAAEDPQMQQILQQNAQSGTGCQPGPAVGAVDFLRGMVVPQIRPGARLIAADPMESATRTLRRSFAPINQQYAAAGLEAQRTGDVGRVRIGLDAGGRPAEEWITATVVANISVGLNSAAMLQGDYNAKSRNFQLTGQDIQAMRAPKGELDARAALFAQILASVQVNPQYVGAVSRFYQAIGQVQNRENANRARMWREAQQYIEQSRQEVAAYQRQSQDRIQEQFGQTLRGVETYTDPRTNERVELSAGWKNAWSNGKGEYIVSDSPSFDPAAELREDWHPMRRGGER
jgi:hypothetical protein